MKKIFFLIFQKLLKTFKKEKLKKVLNSSVQCLNKIEKDPKGPQPMEYCVTIATSAVQSTDFNSNRKSNENFYLDWFLRLGANTKWPTNSRKPDKKLIGREVRTERSSTGFVLMCGLKESRN